MFSRGREKWLARMKEENRDRLPQSSFSSGGGRAAFFPFLFLCGEETKGSGTTLSTKEKREKEWHQLNLTAIATCYKGRSGQKGSSENNRFLI